MADCIKGITMEPDGDLLHGDPFEVLAVDPLDDLSLHLLIYN